MYEMKPLGCDPARLTGLSEKLIVSHYECRCVHGEHQLAERLGTVSACDSTRMSPSTDANKKTHMFSISVENLSASLGGKSAPLIIDVRRREAFLKDTKTIESALRRDPERVSAWARELPSASTVVVCCGISAASTPS